MLYTQGIKPRGGGRELQRGKERKTKYGDETLMYHWGSSVRFITSWQLPQTDKQIQSSDLTGAGNRKDQSECGYHNRPTRRLTGESKNLCKRHQYSMCVGVAYNSNHFAANEYPRSGHGRDSLNVLAAGYPRGPPDQGTTSH